MSSTPSELPTVEGLAPHTGQALDSDRCRGCGSALARDQRYCINCGKPSAEVSKPPIGPATAEPAKAASASGTITPGIAAAGICLSMLFLAAGLIAGRNSSSTTAAPAAQAPIVVRVNGAGGGTADTSGAAGATTAGAAAGSGETATRPAAPKLSAADRAKGAQAQAQLSKIGHLSGKDYSRASGKLPPSYVAPGKLPPPKPGNPGGGSNQHASYG